MALAAIMVHVDFDDHAEDRIGVAAEIARPGHLLTRAVLGCRATPRTAQ